jgi:NADPH:quinone reductase-like Zn-dependent oxidoreductase
LQKRKTLVPQRPPRTDFPGMGVHSMAELRGPRRLRLKESAPSVEEINLQVESGGPRARKADEVVVEVACAAVNPSDVKAAIGMMPYAVWPRTPGRDFSGRVVDGPSDLVGREVWGSSGDLGIRRDGSHATHLLLDADCVAFKPSNISLLEAGAAGVPFVTAWEGLRRMGLPEAGEAVLVYGANGKVGQAVVQIASMIGARVIGVVRGDEGYVGHAVRPPETISSSREDVVARVMELTEGQGAPIVYNTVGSPYFAMAAGTLAKHGRQMLIGTIERTAPFDILQFYRGQHRYFGIDTLAMSTRETTGLMSELAPHFESGALRPFPVGDSGIHGLEEAGAAYSKVMRSDRDRIVLVPR